ncbi:MAG: hypothetical protein RL590_398 [Actinomycetota bacterium]|jgi:DNA-binding NarL/FixJ family response regulator
MVDDDPFTRSTLASSLQVLGCYVITADSVSSALRAIRDYTGDIPPNVALLDLDLGEGPTGLDLAQTLREEFPALAIVILSTYQDPRYLGSNQPPLPVGGIYLVKSSVTIPKVLGDALEQAVENMHRPAKKSRKDGDVGRSELSDKQIEIMRMVAGGLSNAEIAKRLWMTESAVEKSITRLIKNLNLSSSKDQNQRVLIASAYHQYTGSVNVRTES